MPDMDTPSSTETIRILASIQTTNEFILKGMTDLKTEMTKVGEVVQAHAILLQAHGADIALAKQEAKQAAVKTQDLEIQLAGMEPPKSHWSTDNVKVILVVGSCIYALLEVAKMMLTAALHPAAQSAYQSAPK